MIYMGRSGPTRTRAAGAHGIGSDGVHTSTLVSADRVVCGTVPSCARWYGRCWLVLDRCVVRYSCRIRSTFAPSFFLSRRLESLHSYRPPTMRTIVAFPTSIYMYKL